MRNLVRYFGLTFLQYIGVVIAFVVLVVLGARYTPLSLFESYTYMMPTMGLWLAPLTLVGCHSTMALPTYFGVRRWNTFLCVQILAVVMELCTLALAVEGTSLIAFWNPEYDMVLSAGGIPVLLAASLTVTEMALLAQYLPRGAKQRTASVLMVLIIIVLSSSITIGFVKAIGVPLALFPIHVLRPGWAVFSLVCAAAAVILGILTWRFYRKAVIRL